MPCRWQDLSEPAKALLLGMLEYDPAKRLTSKQVTHNSPCWAAVSSLEDHEKVLDLLW